jgi:hypothetical protein
MGNIANRLGRLEARTPPPAPARPGSVVTLVELRAIEAHIRRLEAGADEVRSAPEADVMKIVEPDEEIAAVVREIERLERIERPREGGERWGT